MRSWLVQASHLVFVIVTLSCIAPARTVALTGGVFPSEMLVHTSIDDLNETESRKLTAALRGFAAKEKLSEFPNPPRRIGKAFYIAIFDDTRFSLIFEKATRDLPLVVECQDFSAGTSVCEAALKRLHVFLGEKFPGLLFWVYRMDPQPMSAFKP